MAAALPRFSLQRPRYAELKAVMEQIPDIQKDSLEQFDSKLLNPALQKVADKRRKDHFKRLITGCIGVGDILGETSLFPFMPVPCRSAGAAGLPGSPCPPRFQPGGRSGGTAEMEAQAAQPLWQ